MKPSWFAEADRLHRGILEQRKMYQAYSDRDGLGLTLGVAGEAGEVADVVKKMLRGDFATKEEFLAKLAGELADTRIYLELLAHSTDIDLDMAVENKLKIVAGRWGL